jgi:HEPN domain-containing protein
MSEAKQWLAYAMDDLAYGELGMATLPRAASWSFQQASEKSLKALLLARGALVQRTHDVAYLLSLLSEHCEMSSDLTGAALLIAEVTPATRYPSDDLPPIDGSLARESYLAAKQIVDWVADEMKS